MNKLSTSTRENIEGFFKKKCIIGIKLSRFSNVKYLKKEKNLFYHHRHHHPLLLLPLPLRLKYNFVKHY